jgi:glycerol-3-phosphate dehydrogenase
MDSKRTGSIPGPVPPDLTPLPAPRILDPNPDPQFSGIVPGAAAIPYDVAVVGGGVVGCAVLRELSRYGLRLLLLERESDLAEGATKGNSGVIHAGFNVPPGTLKARTNAAGLDLVYPLARDLGVPHRKTGKLVVAFDDGERRRLEELMAQGVRNGTPDLVLIDEAEIRRLEPEARGRWALYSPHTGIISPYELTIALAECAYQNGARIVLEAGVTAVDVLPSGGFRLLTPRGAFLSRWVINSAGLFSDEVASLAGIDSYRIHPWRGEYLVTDKEAASVLRMPVYPVPSKDDSFLGVHITPTMEGNVLLGPSSEDVPDKSDTSSTGPVMDRLKAKAFELVPALRRYPFIHAYSGLRPKLTGPNGGPKLADFVIEESPLRPRWISLLGIESPGLTAAPAIARMVADMIGGKEDLIARPDFNPERPPVPHFAHLADVERARLAASDSAWGEMICRCEHVTRAEVLAALRNPFGARTLDAIKRRTRCGMGRCQGGFCTPRLVELLEGEGVPVDRITKRGGASALFQGRIKP